LEMATVIRDEKLTKMPGTVKPDSRRRVVLPRSNFENEDIMYHVYTNSLGQIILDPQVTVPASEVWLFENKVVLESVDKGMKESNNGQVFDQGSFARYAKDAI
jgi:hypothetical protein